MIRGALFSAAVMVLGACGQRAPVDVRKVDLPVPAESVLIGCSLAADLGSGPLTQAQVEALWISDRLALRECRQRHAILAAYVRQLLSSFSAK